jgi:hypothetical protein
MVSYPMARSTMAWGLEARVPFLDKAFLEAAMNVDAKEKMFSKGKDQEIDEDGKPKMEKVIICQITDQVALAKCHADIQYILRKAFDCSPGGKVVVISVSSVMILTHSLLALSTPFNLVAAKGAVLRWRWIFLDRWVRVLLLAVNNFPNVNSE